MIDFSLLFYSLYLPHEAGVVNKNILNISPLVVN